MRAVRIETDGIPKNTKTFDVATGEEIHRIKGIDWHLRAGRRSSEARLSFLDGTSEIVSVGPVVR